jgi:hypothetical protein
MMALSIAICRAVVKGRFEPLIIGKHARRFTGFDLTPALQARHQTTRQALPSVGFHRD